jgi:Glu-tRNA(Gln) amidotransferase subunit E-like FAD-binding protein
MVGLTGVDPVPRAGAGRGRELRIRQLSLEEDSCREVSDVGHRITFRTDRLGTPLTEIVTEPDLLTPLELQAGGAAARADRPCDRARCGAAPARAAGCERLGGRRPARRDQGRAPPPGLPLLVHNEAFRQLNLLRIRAELQRRGVAPADLCRIPPPDCRGRSRPWCWMPAPCCRTRTGPLRHALDRGDTVCAVRLPGFARLLGTRRSRA